MFKRLIGIGIIAAAMLAGLAAFPAYAQEPTPTPPVRRYSIESDNYITYTVPYTCADLPALMAGMGLNTAHWQAIYDQGITEPYPAYWAPWLASSLWVNAAQPLSCMMLEQTRYSANLAQRMSNEFTNYSAWNARALSNGVHWIYQGGMYATGVVSTTAQISASWTEWLWLMVDQGLAAATARAANNGRSLVNEFITAWNVFRENVEQAISGVLDEAMLIWNSSVLPVYQHLYGAQVIVVEPEEPSSGWDNLWDFVWWVFGLLGSLLEFIWWLFTFVVENFILVATLPLSFFNAFNQSLSNSGYSLDISCSGDGSNFWCPFLAGVALLNTVIGDDIAYPMVIVGIIAVTVSVFWRDIWGVFSTNVG